MRTNKILARLAYLGVPYNALMVVWAGFGLLLGIVSATVTGLALHHLGTPWWMAEIPMLVLMWAVSLSYYVKTIEFVLHLVRARRNEHLW